MDMKLDMQNQIDKLDTAEHSPLNTPSLVLSDLVFMPRRWIGFHDGTRVSWVMIEPLLESLENLINE